MSAYAHYFEQAKELNTCLLVSDLGIGKDGEGTYYFFKRHI